MVQVPLDLWTGTSAHSQVQTLIAAMIAITNAPLQLAEDPTFHGIINALFEVGRRNPELFVGPLGVGMHRHRTRSAMMEAGQRICKDRIAAFAGRPAVSLAIDAGTIEERHFLDIMVLASHTGLHPFRYKGIEKSNLRVENYGNIVGDTIKELGEMNVDVRLIVGDNLPVQVSALAHSSSRS
jgi:hypothetical protein